MSSGLKRRAQPDLNCAAPTTEDEEDQLAELDQQKKNDDQMSKMNGGTADMNEEEEAGEKQEEEDLDEEVLMDDDEDEEETTALPGQRNVRAAAAFTLPDLLARQGRVPHHAGIPSLRQQAPRQVSSLPTYSL